MRKQKNLNKLSIEGMESWQGYLSKEKRELLIKSWAGTFRTHILPSLPIEKLSQNYSKTMGRPTKDLLTGMGVSILQQMFDLTDGEAREQLAFNQQWHYALETYDPSEQVFSEKTLWTIRHHLTKDGSVQSIFNEVTDKLAKTFKVDTSKQRMDSVHVYSNMARLGRVRLIARTITKFLRNLKRNYPAQYAENINEELRGRYTKEEGVGYFGSAKPSESQKRLHEVATDLNWLIEKYCQDDSIIEMDSYKLMTRVLSEQCVIKEGKVEVKPSKEISSDSLQNPSDIDAGYDGHKGQGYQTQLAETYSRKEKENGNENVKEPVLDLITYVKVESAAKHDSKGVVPAIEELGARDMKPEELLADSLYGSDDNVQQAQEQGVKIVSPVLGKKSEKDYTGFEFDRQTKDVKQCPNGKLPQSVKQNNKGTITARWSKEDCMNCSLKENCQAKNGPRGRRMIYTEKEIRLWQRRQYEGSAEFKDKYRYRSGIEGTNSRYIHQTGARRVRYRGQENVEYAETMKALGINMFRVNKYTNELDKFIDLISNNAIKNVFLLIFIFVREKIRIFYEKYSVNSNPWKIIPNIV